MKEIQEAIKKAKGDDGCELYLFDLPELLHLLSFVAEKQRVRDLAVHSINRTKQFLEIKEEIHKAPLITDQLK